MLQSILVAFLRAFHVCRTVTTMRLLLTYVHQLSDQADVGVGRSTIAQSTILAAAVPEAAVGGEEAAIKDTEACAFSTICQPLLPVIHNAQDIFVTKHLTTGIHGHRVHGKALCSFLASSYSLFYNIQTSLL